jgi:hypothetical protein
MKIAGTNSSHDVKFFHLEILTIFLPSLFDKNRSCGRIIERRKAQMLKAFA